MPDLEATRSFRYATRRLVAGDMFQASDSDARLLIGLKRARRRRSDPLQENLPLTGGGNRRGDPPAPGPIDPDDPDAPDVSEGEGEFDDSGAPDFIEPAPDRIPPTPKAKGRRRGR